MLNKIKLIVDFIGNMGLRYVLFRIWHMFQVKSGIFKKKFPSSPEFKTFITKQEWKSLEIPFFFESREDLKMVKNLDEILDTRFRESKKNNITFFNNRKIQLNQETQWIENPVSNHTYDVSKHWSEIPDLSKEAGDIKFVWEKARFSFLYDIIRYDYHSENDQAKFVFSEIEDFIDKNPINQGPNYKCSQEISLRILNWTFAINYYKNSDVLTEFLFEKIINSIYWQLKHVYNNINFSRIAVRNNHAITETLTLYFSELFFPFIGETKKWSKKGKKWFEQEIDYQIYDDGTFLQYSMNYHRVVIQLLTWGIKLSELNGERFHESVYIKAQKSLDFLDSSIDESSGKLPNYGSNDGALFFKLSNDDYRVYKTQLDDLRMVLSNKTIYNSESFSWYGLKSPIFITRKQKEIATFEEGGYYIINEPNSKTFIRCGRYKDRPAQADNLHMDIWVDGENYIWDCGSYKYNTEQKFLKHFMGSTGHNTITVDDNDQMLKGGRFIWYKWVKKAEAKLYKKDSSFIFNGSIEAFRQIGTRKHTRIVEKSIGKLQWKILDTIDLNNNELLKQHWHINPKMINKISFNATDGQGNEIKAIRKEKWYSSYYGSKEDSVHLIFITKTDNIKTTIRINN